MRYLKTAWIIVILITLIPIQLGNAGNVKDNNNGVQGNILVHNGNIQGKKNDVGTWTDPTNVASLKGEKGDKGKRGKKGKEGEQGTTGQQGTEGQKGAKGDTGVGLEGVQYNIMGEINLLQGRRWKLGTYGKYNVNRNEASEVGLKITISLSDSWEAKEIDKVNARLKKLESKLNSHNIETETIKKDGNTWTIRIKDKNDAKKVIRSL